MQSYTASCHCEAVRFAFEAEPFTRGVRCNCSFCAKRGTMVHLVPSTQFTIDAKEGALGVYQFGRMQAKHYFCHHCGVSTFSETTRWPGHHIVNLGCVDGVDILTLETTLFDGKHLL